jgi:hypothetical protein
MKVQPNKCATCPWQAGSPYADLREQLEERALGHESRVCHSTGSNNAINRQTGKPEMICRGARDVQLHMLWRLGFLSEATDAAWDAKCRALGMEPNNPEGKVKH